MFDNDQQIQSLRKAYKKNLWLNLSAVAVSLLFAGFMLIGKMDADLTVMGITAGLGVVVAIADYVIEHALYQKGKNAFIVLTLCMILPPFSLLILCGELDIPGVDAVSVTPYWAAFIFLRAAIPLIQLLRDGARLREGDLCETVGSMKKNTRRVDSGRERESCILFEDELTHETHLLRVSSISPTRRYRVFYLPHSGLAVGEVIPDDVTFDPFGNPIEREVPKETAEETYVYAEKPAYDENGGYTEKPNDNEDGGYATAPDEAEEESETAPPSFGKAYTTETESGTAYRDSQYDPNSDARKKAARYAKASAICKVLTFICFGLMFIGAIAFGSSKATPAIMLLILPPLVTILLSGHFHNRELKLRCTNRTSAICIDTVRRRSGKHSHLHPIVEYEVEGVTHTAELSISCGRHAVGEMYTIYYDPLDPDTVMVG